MTKLLSSSLSLFFLFPILGACSSTQEKDPKIGPLETSTTPRPITEIDMYLQIWNNMLLSEPSEQNTKQMEAAANALELQMKERFDEFTKWSETGSTSVRIISTAALGFSKDARALPYLMRALNDSDAQVVGSALIGLGVLMSPDTPTEQINQLLNHHPDRAVRTDAAFAMKRLAQAGVRNEAMLLALREALKDSEAGVRVQSAAALGFAKDTGAVNSLLPLLSDSKPLIASASAFALGKIKDPRAMEGLIRLLESPSPRVREAAHTALVEIAGEDRGPSAWDWKKTY